MADMAKKIQELDEIIASHENVIKWLCEQRRELINRSGANKPSSRNSMSSIIEEIRPVIRLYETTEKGDSQ